MDFDSITVNDNIMNIFFNTCSMDKIIKITHIVQKDVKTVW